MKLLFDQNLSHRLPSRLADAFPDSEHVRHARLDRATDEAIWNYAKGHGFAIVTQDADFAERSRLFGSPPRVIWLRCRNTTPRNIELLLREHRQAIAELISEPEGRVLEILRP